jgi:hypothetical protein
VPVTAHWFPEFETQMGAKVVNLSSDTLTVGLVASGTFTWGATPEGYTYVSQFLAGDGTDGALTEVSLTGTNYTRKNLTSVAFSASGEVVTLTAASPSWVSGTFSTCYGWLYDSTAGTSDSTHPIMCYWDFGGTTPVTGATLNLTVPGSGLITWTGS